MRRSFLAGIVASLGLTIAGTAVFANQAQASFNQNTYYCAQLNGEWNTFVNTPRGRVKLIQWAKSFSQKWTPKNRCTEISGRFQRFLDNGNLKYIRTGNVNNLPVICVADEKGGSCPDPNVLITLEPNTDPESVLIRLVDFRRSVSGQTIVLSENDSGFYVNGEFYVDMDKFLENVPVETP